MLAVAKNYEQELTKIFNELAASDSEWDCVLGNEEGYNIIVQDILKMEGVI